MSNIVLRYKLDYNTVFTELTIPKAELLKLFTHEANWFTGNKPLVRMSAYRINKGTELNHVHPHDKRYDTRHNWFVRDDQIVLPDTFGELCLPKKTVLIGKQGDAYVYLLPPTVYANVIFTLRLVALHSNGQPFPGELVAHDQLFEILD